MRNFFKTAHLPDRPVRALIIGETYYPLLKNGLSALGIEAVCCPENPFVDPRLAYHADLSVYHFGGKRFVLAKYLENTEFSVKLLDMGAEFCYSNAIQGREYPADAGLCALPLGEKVFHNREFSDPAILGTSRSFQDVSQGYSKCAACITGNNSAISSDVGMVKALRGSGVEVLEITAGHIRLPGYDYGFIGGAAFLIAPATLAFTGSLDKHPDMERILAFLKSKGITVAFLSEEHLFDIGSAFPIY